MCQTADNSLEANLAAQTKMLRNGKVTPDEIPSLTIDAIKAEKTYRILMEQSRWTPEELFLQTGYRILTSSLTPPSRS